MLVGRVFPCLPGSQRVKLRRRGELHLYRVCLVLYKAGLPIPSLSSPEPEVFLYTTHPNTACNIDPITNITYLPVLYVQLKNVELFADFVQSPSFVTYC